LINNENTNCQQQLKIMAQKHDINRYYKDEYYQ